MIDHLRRLQNATKMKPKLIVKCPIRPPYKINKTPTKIRHKTGPFNRQEFNVKQTHLTGKYSAWNRKNLIPKNSLETGTFNWKNSHKTCYLTGEYSYKIGPFSRKKNSA